MQVIGALSVYNEEPVVVRALEQFAKLGIFAVSVHDGPWEGHGATSGYSTDRTKAAVLDWAHTHKDSARLTYIEEGRIYKSQGEKRNRQLHFIDQEYGRRPYCVFVLDADETIRFVDGRMISRISEIPAWELDCVGMVRTYGEGSSCSDETARLLPGGKAIHYHTERSMIIHDADCRTICNYDPHAFALGGAITFQVPGIFLVNHWQSRPDGRLGLKQKYLAGQYAKDRSVPVDELPPCRKFSL